MTKIIIFSDLHYAPEKPIHNGSIIDRKLMEQAEPILDTLIDKINNQIKPDLVINLGDLIEDFNDYDKDLMNLNYIWNKLKNIESPFYSCIGNHDLRSMSSRNEIEKIMNYKHSTFSVNIKGMHIVILGTYVNNELDASDGGIPKTQFVSDEDIKWLENDLNKNELPTIICTHYGIAEDDMKHNWWFETNPEHALLGNRKKLKNIFKNNKKILAVLSGHQHWTKTIIENEILYYVIGSLTENINDDGVPDGVYFILEFDGIQLKITEKHIRL